MNDRVSSKVRRRRRCSARPAPPVPMAAQVITVAGYASLMDEASARSTTPSLSNWRCAAPRPTCAPQDPCVDLNRRSRRGRYGWVDGWVRVFDLVSIINLRRGLGRDRRIGTCTARPAPPGTAGRLRCCLYDVPAEEYPTLLARERRLVEQLVQCHDDAGSAPPPHTPPHTHPSPCHSLPPPSTLPSRRCAATGSARLFVGWSDEVCPHMGPCWHTAAVLLLVAPLLIAPLLHVPHAALPSLLLQVPPNYGCASGFLCL